MLIKREYTHDQLVTEIYDAVEHLMDGAEVLVDDDEENLTCSQDYDTRLPTIRFGGRVFHVELWEVQ